jgi:predicted outer membrane protein
MFSFSNNVFSRSRSGSNVLAAGMLITSAAALAVTPNETTTPAPAEPASGISIPDQKTPGADRSATLNDESFGKAAKLNTLGEAELARVAQERSRNLRVKLLADTVLEDRASIDAELEKIARSKKMNLPEKLGVEQQAALSSLKLQSEEKFDTAYVMQMREENVKAIALFQEARSSAALSHEMREFASMGLKILLANQQKTLSIEVPVKPARVVPDPQQS